MNLRKFSNKSKKNLFLQNHRVNLNQTWRKAFLGEGDSSVYKGRAPLFFKEEIMTK